MKKKITGKEGRDDEQEAEKTTGSWSFIRLPDTDYDPDIISAFLGNLCFSEG